MRIRISRWLLVAAVGLLVPAGARAQTSVQLAIVSGGGASQRPDGGTVGLSIGQAVAGTNASGFFGFRYLADRATRTSADAPVEVPDQLQLHQNYPNPFNPRTTVRFDLPAPGPVRIDVFDALGRRVRTALDATLPAGRHDAVLEADRLPSGMYVYRLEAAGRSLTRRMVVLK